MAGAILVLGRDLVMVPKLIHPLPPSTPRTPGHLKLDSEDLEDEQEPPTPHPTTDTWMQVRPAHSARLQFLVIDMPDLMSTAVRPG